MANRCRGIRWNGQSLSPDSPVEYPSSSTHPHLVAPTSTGHTTASFCGDDGVWFVATGVGRPATPATISARTALAFYKVSVCYRRYTVYIPRRLVDWCCSMWPAWHLLNDVVVLAHLNNHAEILPVDVRLAPSAPTNNNLTTVEQIDRLMGCFSASVVLPRTSWYLRAPHRPGGRSRPWLRWPDIAWAHSSLPVRVFYRWNFAETRSCATSP